MQVSCVFQDQGTQLLVTMPPSTSIAPPGNYMLFAVSRDNRPSQAVYIGLGGAVPAPLFTDPPANPIFADGTYTIINRGRRGQCAPNLSYQPCSLSNDPIMDTQGESHNLEHTTCIHAYCCAWIQENKAALWDCTVSRLLLSSAWRVNCEFASRQLHTSNDVWIVKVKYSRTINPSKVSGISLYKVTVDLHDSCMWRNGNSKT